MRDLKPFQNGSSGYMDPLVSAPLVTRATPSMIIAGQRVVETTSDTALSPELFCPSSDREPRRPHEECLRGFFHGRT